MEKVFVQLIKNELSDEILKLEDNLTKKERLLAETQDNLKVKESYLDQTKIDKNKKRITELESKKKKLFDYVLTKQQVFITCTDYKNIINQYKNKDITLIHIKNGNVIERGSI